MVLMRAAGQATSTDVERRCSLTPLVWGGGTGRTAPVQKRPV